MTTLVKDESNVIPFVPNSSFYFSYGVQAFQKRSFDRAVRWLKKAIEINENEPLYKCQLSVVYTEVGSYHAANQLLNEVLREKGDTYPDCYYLMANNYAHLGLFQDASRYLDTYMERDPEGEFKEAAEQLKEMIDSLEPEEKEDFQFDEEDELLVYQETVHYHLEHHEWEEALALLEEMMNLFPTFPLTNHQYAYALFHSGNREAAVDMEREWLEETPEDILCHINLVTFYVEMNQFELMKHHIFQLKNVYPMHEEQQLAVAVALTRAGEYTEAVDRFRMLGKKAVKNRYQYLKWYSIASFYCGDPFKSEELWKRGTQRFPELTDSDGPWITG
ncbi:tetratricopeptide repeat protein [Salimicrobium flavidum]|uniref:Tetratricopeptide repeat-containing protein n=1 Tax=Salimicrobium flavidum TaxID=570947 RepID=A0A1N7J202_9BACI|nr:tetratricopeptide repeat protein [Salimicrobium flavidum]SIS43296.1 Tetratricopeptide repeat-containing protein [Salimicrobium flavidum]